MTVNSDWIAPTEFPDLSDREKIAIDLETCDPGLIKDGPGWPKKTRCSYWYSSSC